MTEQDDDIKLIPLEDLILDDLNPRLPNTLVKDEEHITTWLYKNSDVLELMNSIGSQGYFSGEPILVTREGAPEGKYIVVEGNCRLTACKLLQDPNLLTEARTLVTEASASADHKPLSIPALVYEKRAEILVYLGYRHVKGVHAWDALQKARYLQQLKALVISKGGITGAEVYKQLAREIGSRADYVAALLTGAHLYDKIIGEDILAELEISERDIRFSLITTALSYREIYKYLGLKGADDETAEDLDLTNLKYLTSWMFQKNSEGFTRLGESRNLKVLAAVVSHEAAIKRFIAGDSLENAAEWSNHPLENYRDAIETARSSLDRAYQVIQNVQKTDPSDVDKLIELNSAIKSIHTLTKSKSVEEEGIEELE